MLSSSFRLGWPVLALACALSVACGSLLGIDDVDYAVPDAPDARESVLDEGAPSMDHYVDVALEADGGREADAVVPAEAQTGCDPANPPTDDPKNCGACNYDCVGGACSGGLCQPVAVAIGQARPFAIAADEEGVYFTNLGTAPSADAGDAGPAPSALMACEGDPCVPVEIASAYAGPSLLAITKDAVFVAPKIAGTSFTAGALHGYWRKDHAGLPSFPFGASSPHGLFGVKGAKEYLFVDTGDSGNAFGRGAYRCTLDSKPTYVPCEPITPQNSTAYGMIVATTSNVVLTSVDDTRLYQADNINSRVSGHQIVDLTSDGKDVFWITTHTAQPTIWRCDDGCGASPTSVATANGTPIALAADATGIYWVNAGTTALSGSIQWVRAGGAIPQAVTITKNLHQPQRIALTQRFLYFTEMGTGNVMRLAKPF